MTDVLVSSRISDECERALLLRGFNVIRLPESRSLSGSAVSTHPDSLMLLLGDTLLTSCDYCDDAAYVLSDLREAHGDLRICLCDVDMSPRFPDECAFNAAVVGNMLFARLDSLCESIKSYAEDQGIRLIGVKQGYPACATLFLGERAITADEGLARAYEVAGLKVTRISAGSISLPPHEYGFIGGASGVYGDTVYFFGDITTHPDSRVILDAIEEEGYRAVSLSRGGLVDLGGMIFLPEERR